MIRKLVIWTIAIMMCILGVWGVVHLKFVRDQLVDSVEGFKTTIECPQSVAKIQAWYDHQKKPEKRVGLMHCYCLDLQRHASPLFEDSFSDIASTADEQYCVKWQESYGSQTTWLYTLSIMVISINIVICFIFQFISRWEKHHTLNSETRSQFYKITIM